jgi:hypothetical protein
MINVMFYLDMFIVKYEINSQNYFCCADIFPSWGSPYIQDLLPSG